MTTLRKKIGLVVIALTISAWIVGPGVVFGATADELAASIAALQAQLVALQAQLVVLQGTPAAGAPAACSGITFDRNLKQGMAGNDVKCLQALLNQNASTQVAASGVGSSGNETTYFGALTKAAVVKFQEKYASDVLTPLGLTVGTGFVGTKTIAKLNVLLGTVPAGCSCTAWVNDVCGGTCEATQMRQTRTCTAAACAVESQCVADSTCVVAPTTAAVSKADDSPAASSVAGKAQDVPFLKLKFTAGATAYKVTKVIVTRGGTSADSDLSDLKLYDGATRLGSAQALNTTTHKATFSALSWQIPANSTKYLTITGSINTIAVGYATTGDSVQLGVSALTDVTSDVALTGTFPIWSAAKTIAGISVGYLDVDKQTVPAATTILSGSTEQEIASWRFAANVTEGFTVNRIKVTQVGSAASLDISNLKLKYAGTQVGSTVANLGVDNTVTFDLSSAPLTINASTSKIIYAYADVTAGIWTSRTVKFEITEYTDVTAYGANSGGAVTITCDADLNGTGTDAFVKQTGAEMTIGQGSMTIDLDNAQNPAAQIYVKGTSNRLMTALKLSTGAREGVRITELKLTLAGVATDIANITLWDGTTQIAGPASITGTYVKFGTNTIGWDDPGVFDLAASTNKTILVKADIPSGATATNTLKLSIASASDVKADGSTSKYDVASTAITGTAVPSVVHTISGKGNLIVSVSSTAPTNQTFVKGTTGKEYTKINFTADSGEDIVVSAVTIYAYKSTDTASALSSGDITNVKMLKSDGTQYGSTIASGASAMSFSGSLTVAASTTQTVTVVADIPSTVTDVPYVNIDVRDTATYTSDVTATGVSSSAEIVETGSANSTYMTVGTGTLILAAASSPADQPVIINATGINYLGIVMTAGTAEDVRVTMLKLTRTGKDDTIGGISYDGDAASDNDVANIALYNAAGTKLTTAKSLTTATVTFSASDFANSSGIDISKGQQMTIYVKADAPATATSGKANALGINNASSGSYFTHIAATGLSSGTTLTTSTITLTAGPGSCSSGVNYVSGGHANCYQVGLASAGALTVAENAGRPETARLAVGTYGTSTEAVFYKVDLKAVYESIYIKSVTVTRPATCGTGAEACGLDSDFASVDIYDGTTKLGSQALLSGTTTFNFPSSSYWTVPNGTTKTLTIKGVLNGVYSAGATLPGDYTKLCLGASGVTVQGVSSGSTSVTITGNDAALCGQEQSLSTSVPTITVGSLPTNVLSAGTQTLYNFTVLADSKGAISWGRIAFQVTGLASQDGTIRTIGSDDTTSDYTDGVYTVVAGSTVDDKRILSNLKVWRGTTDVAGTFYYRTDSDASAGTYVVFAPTAEEVIEAGGSKSYTLQGDFTLLPNANAVLGTVNTKISNLSSSYDANLVTAATQRIGTYALVAKNSSDISEDANDCATTTTNSRSFIWSDGSGCVQAACSAQTTHAAGTYDWFADYKVVGIPSTTLTLTK